LSQNFQLFLTFIFEENYQFITLEFSFLTSNELEVYIFTVIKIAKKFYFYTSGRYPETPNAEFFNPVM